MIAMEVIPKLDITAAIRYVNLSDFFLSAFWRSRDVAKISEELVLSGMSSMGELCFRSSTTKQTVRIFRLLKPLNLRDGGKTAAEIGWLIRELEEEKERLSGLSVTAIDESPAAIEGARRGL